MDFHFSSKEGWGFHHKIMEYLQFFLDIILCRDSLDFIKK